MTRTLIRACLTLAIAAALGACASTGPIDDRSAPAWTPATLADTEWTEICPGSDPEQTWIALRPDGSFAYRYPGEGWSHDGDERWRVAGGDLVVSWNDGYAVSRYRLEGSRRLEGETTKSCAPIILEHTGDTM